MKSNEFIYVDLAVEDILDAIEKLENLIKSARGDYFTMCANHKGQSDLSKQELMIAKMKEELERLKGQLTITNTKKIRKSETGLEL